MTSQGDADITSGDADALVRGRFAANRLTILRTMETMRPASSNEYALNACGIPVSP